MPLSRLIINNFRNLQSLDLELSPNFNFIVGHNGSGKTSLLEAIFYLGHGRSFKSHISNRIINYQSEDFVLHGRIDEGQHQWSVGIQKKRSGDTLLKINGEDGNKISDLAHLLPMQVITPEGLTLLNGGPTFRRAFLDWGLFHQYTEFYSCWANLKRLLKQRNAALHQVRSYAELKPWDTELAKLAEIVSQMRANYAEALRPEIEKTCQFFLPELEIGVSFHQGWEKGADYAEILAQGFERDKAMGYTMIGPQKADFRFRANGLPVEDVLSRGQLKLLMCVLRLAQGEYLVAQKERQCLFLIDDFASELDPIKRELLAHRLRESGSQVFVTAITKDQLNQMQWQESEQDSLFQVQQGMLTK
ncbi:DNA replication/repair protein RecF [Actinobacillus pleuropneumoniae]|uniref:DNA replication and repair protein RecF n=1 Tax=Actinobacillus pleuropneumoniae TaxID=715 RepID=A0A3S4ZTF9_ACTPL|nr:DNA replication/repair protein RecF [Actinobacillus pleuropneumoniae]EFL79439.1 recombination protein F [Actinobacillus pleuropneumoniae serovar 2 str. 4226]EFM86610.1 DNA replication and repair protein recF [Actinobacillus pleuropneumoniae serovar 2 str. S1536]MEE3618390.1 DNA replication/repair protein RecF [Actinobacillus pleuropneumoniae]UKH08327.1 DNA replication/repair protein RecF [Actinobacillus pleuropneumoniae]UKH44767.1 DNA replication/repair protein RecF [Actinobacillus pleuropn